MNSKYQTCNIETRKSESKSRKSTALFRGLFRGFTIIEMLIVIGIITVLVALTATVGVRFKEKAEVDEVKNLLLKLEVILQEWEVRAGRDLLWGLDGFDEAGNPNAAAAYDLQEDTPHVFGLTELLKTVARPREIKDMIGQIKPAFVHCYNCDPSITSPPPLLWLPVTPSADDPDPNADQARDEYTTGKWDKELSILDTWGIPLRIIHPGRVWSSVTDNPDERNDDGTLFTMQEQSYGIAVGRRICFVSAGPDNKFGNLQLDLAVNSRDKKLVQQAADNIYSYEIQKPEAP